MVDFFLKIFDFLKHRHSLCYGLIVAMTGVLLVMVSSLKYNENIIDFMPMDDNEQKAITLYQDISGGQRVIGMFKINNDDTTAIEQLTDAVDTFALKIQSSPDSKHITEIITQVDFDKISGVTDFIYQNMPMMLVDSDYVFMERILTNPDSMERQVAKDVQMMMMPATGLFNTNISNDPFGLFNSIINRLQAKQTSMPFEMDNGYIFTHGQRYALVMMTSPYGAMETAGNSQLVHFIDSIAKQTMQVCPNVDIAFTGSPVIAVGNANQIRKDSYWAISIAVTFIIMLLIFSFRKTKNILLIGVAILFGWLFAMGFTAVLRSDVSLIVLGIGSIIIGIAVNYPLHFVAHIDHGGSVRETLKEMVPPLLIGNITTVGAFASLIPLDAPALRDLGLFAVFMLLGTILFVLVFLPHLVKQKASSEKEHLSFGRISSFSPNRYRWMLWAIAILTLIFGYFSLNTSFDANMHNVNYMTDEQKSLLSDLSTSVGINDTSSVYIATEGDSWDEALKEREKVSPLLEQLKLSGKINQYSSVSSFICSIDEQQRRISMWNQFWDKHRKQAILSLNQLASKYGFSEDAFDGFREIIEKEYKPCAIDHFEPIQSAILNNSFSESTGKCTVVDVIDASNCDVKQIESTLNDAVKGKGYAFDFVGMNSAVASSLSDNFNYIGFACGFIVFLFLWISFGRIELALLAFLPMAMGWIWILGIMYLLGIQFNIVNVILATFIFGQGDDYTIFITDGLINEYAYHKKLLKSYKNSIIISALILFIGMGALIVAKHPALHSLAEVTIVGMFTVVLMAWIVPPLIFEWLVKTKNKLRHTPVTLKQVIRTSYCAIVYSAELAFGCLIGLFIKLFGGKSSKCKDFFHRVICKSMRANINHIWGVKSVIHNEVGEKFDKGGIIVCNHQSSLDPIYLLALDPHILIVKGGKVWKNPIMSPLFKMAGFINLDQSIEGLKNDVANAVSSGYNVAILSEDMSSSEQIPRFHEGALQIAEEIGADILPIYLHGANHVMPKDSGFVSSGQVDVIIGERIGPDRFSELGSTQSAIADGIHSLYQENLNQMRLSIETSHYFHDYVISKYIYKGAGIERETKRLLKTYDDFSKWIDDYQPDDKSSQVVSVLNAGRGQFSLLLALVHPELIVHSYSNDPDDVALATCCEPLPENLQIFYSDEQKMSEIKASGGNIIDLQSIIK